MTSKNNARRRNNRAGQPWPPSDDFNSAGDLGPEGVLFISEEDSSTGEPLVALSHEISNTVTLYTVSELDNTFVA